MTMIQDTLQFEDFQATSSHSKSEIAEILYKIEKMLKNEPQIAQSISDDLDKTSKSAKHLRNIKEIPDSPDLIDFIFPEKTTINHIKFQVGRPRTTPHMVVAIALLSELAHGFNSHSFRILLENCHLIDFANRHNGGKIPGSEACRLLIKSLSQNTLTMILNYTCKVAKKEKLDDFKVVIGDSTHTSANSRKPSDSELLYFTSMAILHLIMNGFKLYETLLSRKEIKVLNRLKTKICQARHHHNLSKSKQFNKQKNLLKLIKFHIDIFNFSDQIFERIEEIYLPNTKWQRLKVDLEMELMNLFNLLDCIPSKEKFDSANQPKLLSRSDADASWIIKGNREPHFGYRVQILSSENGMISAVHTPKGNQQDNTLTIKLIENHLTHLPETKFYSFDDGYTSKNNYDWATKKGLTLVLKGAKAKNLLGDDYDDEVLAEIRRKRSIIEGQIGRLKQITTMNRLQSRGHNNVQKEILRKCVLANFLTLIRLEKKCYRTKKIA